MLPLLQLPLLAICCFVPGFFFVRRLRLTADEKLCASIGLSLIILYLVSGTIYLLGVSWRWCWVSTALFCLGGLWCTKDLRRLLRRRHVRQQMAAFAMLIALGLLILALVQHYSGALWAADWKEHHERTNFFLDRLPYATNFIGLYILPARPPMMHLIGAYILAHLGQESARGYDAFQIVSLVLNALVFFPCILIAGMLIRHGSRRVWLIGAFLATSPVFMQNVTWTWNKMLTAFFVVLSLAFYVRGWRKQSAGRIVAAAMSLAAAVLVHYSAGPYAVVLGLHYPLIFLRRRRKAVEILGSLACGGALLATWFAWSILSYGAGPTFGSNTTAVDTRSLTVSGNLQKVASNLYSSLVAYPLRHTVGEFIHRFTQPNPFGMVRDYYFLLCQQNLPLSLGLLGGAFAGYLAIKRLRQGERSLSFFWCAFIVIIVLLGIAAIGSLEPFGVAHICLQPLTFMGIALLAGGFASLPRWARVALVFSTVVDVILGIILQTRIEMLAFHGTVIEGKTVVTLSKGLLNVSAVLGSIDRYRHFLLVFYGDHFTRFAGLILGMLIAAYGAIVLFIANSAALPALATIRFRLPAVNRIPVVARVALAVYLAAALLCVSDRMLGFEAVDEPPIASALSSAKAEELLRPLRDAVRANRESAKAHYALAETQYYLGRFEAAWNEIHNATLLDPRDQELHYLMAVMARLLPDLPAADNYRARIIFDGTYRDSAENYLTYGSMLLAEGFDTKALEVFSDAVRRYPANARAYHGLAWAQLRAGQAKEARASAEKALQLEPGSREIADRLRIIMDAQKR